MKKAASGGGKGGDPMDKKTNDKTFREILCEQIDALLELQKNPGAYSRDAAEAIITVSEQIIKIVESERFPQC